MVEKMTEEQKQFMSAKGKVIVKACPGSGKTYTVAHKLLSYVDNWKYYHRGVAVLSFTNVASNEIYEKAQAIRGSLGKLGYPHFIGTVDSFIDEFIVLRYGHLHTVGKVRPRIALSDSWKFQYKYWRIECHQKGCIDSIEEFYYSIDGKFYKGNEQVNCECRNARALPCQQYKRMLSDRDIVFQNETALFAYQILKKYPSVASAITERFPIIIIDEAQDTSINQMAVFELISNSGMESMFLVGDPDQAIYEWRNANPECFLKKMQDPNWKTLDMTGNFRSSQNICNVTSFFSASLKGENSNKAIGDWKNEKESPILLLTNDNTEDEIVNYFLDKCGKMGIGISPKTVAVLTRGRVHSDTDITGLWKSKEIELFAKAAYDWEIGSRKKAYQEASLASFYMIFNEDVDIHIMNQKIRNYTDEDLWKDYVIDILVSMPNIEIGIAEWTDKFSDFYCSISAIHGYTLSPVKTPKSVFKIKQSDKQTPHFKQIPLRKYFEKIKIDKYTRSSIHGVKGETYDAVLIHIRSRSGNTIYPKLLMQGNLDQEMMRLAYVAMTRPRRLLMIAMPDTKGINTCGRFSEKMWSYEVLESHKQCIN